MKLYLWTRKDVGNAKTALLVGTPFVLLASVRAFGEGGEPMLKVLVIAMLLSLVAVAGKMIVTRRAFGQIENNLHG